MNFSCATTHPTHPIPPPLSRIEQNAPDHSLHTHAPHTPLIQLHHRLSCTPHAPPPRPNPGPCKPESVESGPLHAHQHSDQTQTGKYNSSAHTQAACSRCWRLRAERKIGVRLTVGLDCWVGAVLGLDGGWRRGEGLTREDVCMQVALEWWNGCGFSGGYRA
ncbi:hypothetical protein CC86DRAFT_104053 [Ophiobolus disseminans]|uniref:Uncharacterized protein n=1 Tax=Ophiobolus disseminans TaxID=1469910 RepID=A0A6A6ZM51_9PLEO|nr:hypothetical protein CC86DRAFT_104053 [Ophiobolus disseminans]